MRNNYLGTPVCIMLAIFSIFMSCNYSLAFNITASIPGKLFLIKKHVVVHRGNVVAAVPSKSARTPEGVRHLKIVRGMPDDVVAHRGSKVFINGEFVGIIKTKALTGRVLAPGITGRLKKDEYFLWTPHKDSYDSRYLEVGNYKAAQIIGVATRISLLGLT